MYFKKVNDVTKLFPGVAEVTTTSYSIVLDGCVTGSSCVAMGS